MRAGKSASLILALTVSAVAVAVSFSATVVPWVASLTPPERLLLLGGVLGLVTTTLLLPLGAAIDRTVVRLRSYLEATGSSEGKPPIFYGPKWMRPLSSAFTSAVDQFRDRERALSNDLSEMEIRCRVSEVERRQTEAVLHALRDAVLVTNAFGDIVVANEVAGLILGFDPTEAIHRPLE